MIDIEAWLRELDEEEDVDIKNNEEYQTKLFEEYVLRSTNHAEERKKLNTRYQNGEPVMGEHGLRKELAAFDLSDLASTMHPRQRMTRDSSWKRSSPLERMQPESCQAPR